MKWNLFIVVWMFMLGGAGSATNTYPLAAELLKEQDVVGARRECLRVLALDPSNEQARATLRGCDQRSQAPVHPVTTSRPGGKPGEAIVAFYRSQINPAIGQRCSLQPSCSEYFRQASRKYGIMGVPMIGDRLVREPSLVHASENTVVTNGLQKVSDPLSDHTPWLKEPK